MSRLTLPVAGVLLSIAAVVMGQAGAPADLDAAFRAYWQAGSISDAERAGKQVVTAGASFDVVLGRLKAGRSYGAQQAGAQELPTSLNGITLDNTLTVPARVRPCEAVAPPRATARRRRPSRPPS